MVNISQRQTVRAIKYYGSALAILGRFSLGRLRFRNRPVNISFRRHAPLSVVKGRPAQRAGGRAVPRIVWMYWNELDPPEIVQFAKRRIEALNPDYEVRLLNRHTIVEWLPEFNYPSELISIQHFTDVLRLDLLEAYGGVWIDASLLCFAPLCALFCGKIEDPKSDSDLFAFYIDKFSSHYDPPIIENWFLAAPPGSVIIKAWRKELEVLRAGGEENFSAWLKALPDYDELKQEMLLDEYLVSHIALQKALKRLDNYKLWLERAEDEAFAFQVSGSWDPHVLVRDLLGRTFHGKPPRVVKLTGYDRHLADLLVRRGLVDQHSLLGRAFAEDAESANGDAL
ncbi:hypothetical protein C41B8_07487 [Salinisphaera hydrothermalis C41B8]|uniref:Mannosyltransferase OCH1-like enzyme n=2 Tax=Salinisphaera TaxID=180541 RepID=A0A084IMD7_SALHC|nr:hypothetical protein C41B8_07487 [Salinisphaera hydrothermalis C41B8]